MVLASTRHVRSFMNHKIGEYDFSDANRDWQRERRFRLRALERLLHDEDGLQELREDSDEAVKLLRVTLGDAPHEPRNLYLAVRAVIAARGNLNGLGLGVEELAAMVQFLVERTEPLPRAA